MGPVKIFELLLKYINDALRIKGQLGTDFRYEEIRKKSQATYLEIINKLQYLIYLIGWKLSPYWIDEEISDFKQGETGGQVFPIILDFDLDPTATQLEIKNLIKSRLLFRPNFPRGDIGYINTAGFFLDEYKQIVEQYIKIAKQKALIQTLMGTMRKKAPSTRLYRKSIIKNLGRKISKFGGGKRRSRKKKRIKTHKKNTEKM